MPKGKYIRTPEIKEKNRIAGLKRDQSNENHACWKGDKIKYSGLHEWIRKNKEKPSFCEKCKIKKPFEVANISGEYKRDINDFLWLCRSCHLKMDYKSGIRKPRGKKNGN